MASNALADGKIGCLVAQGLGDAIGFLVEGHHPLVCSAFVAEAWARETAPGRTRGSFSFGQYSDDTQLARELALSFVHSKGWNPADFARRLAQLFRDDTIVGRGQATQAAAERILRGIPWDKAGEPAPSAGNGAAMRAAPVGLMGFGSDDRWRIADEQARITHLDLRSRAAAILVADVVGDLLDGRDPYDPSWSAHLAERVASMDQALSEGVRSMPALLSASEDDAATWIAKAGTAPAGSAHKFEQWHGISPFATPSVLFALYAFLRSPRDADAVLRCSVAVGGDVDTVAAMAGAMVGAHVGWSGLSDRLRRWAERLNDQGTFGLEELSALAQSLGREQPSGA